MTAVRKDNMATTKTANVLARARAAMPGLAAVEASLADVDARLVEVRESTTASAIDRRSAIVASIADGGAVPHVDDIADQLEAADRRNARAQLAHDTLVRARDALRDRRARVHADQAAAALAVLAGELDALLDEAGPVLAALDGTTTADGAIARGVIDAWTTATALAARYRVLRGAQRTIVSAALTPSDKPGPDRVTNRARRLVDVLGTVADFDRHADPDHLTDELAGRPDARRPPLPWAQEGFELSNLQFVARNDVKAWIPNLTQLDQASTRVQDHDSPEPQQVSSLSSSSRIH